ncbi:unnamed protein product [Mycena citricolor]|uniref:DUF6533 domain-containing protein n=1 Tax=Mycena citricolor TaxID=2018698 RepID=A0AAD2Q1Z5_9AGAR|nr:unnamed protein product [Mycena citricolor]
MHRVPARSSRCASDGNNAPSHGDSPLSLHPHARSLVVSSRTLILEAQLRRPTARDQNERRWKRKPRMRCRFRTPYWARSTARILVVIPYTVLVYDYFLTIQLEVSGFWTTSFTWGSFFFYLNRYSSLLGTIPVVVQFWLTTTDPGKIPVPDDSFWEIKDTGLTPALRCHSLRMYHQYFALISQVLVACILIMRTYALYSKNKLVLGVMISITLSAFASAMTLLLTGNNESTLSPELQVYGCPFATAHAKYVPSLVSSWLIRLADSSRQEHTIHSGLAEAWAGMLVFDSMIFVLTLYKALSIETRRGDLLTVLVRDGTIYFGRECDQYRNIHYGQRKPSALPQCVISIVYCNQPFIRGSATNVTSITSSVMISRLMFNLHESGRRRDQSQRWPGRHSLATRSSSGARETDLPVISTLGPRHAAYTMDTEYSTDEWAETASRN